METDVKRASKLLLAALVAAAVGCGGSSDGAGTCASPIALTQGPWCITITSTVNTCQAGIAPPYTAIFTQDGTVLSATALSGTYSGAICGNVATMTGSQSGVTVSVSIDFSTAIAGAGTTRWDTGTCSGTDRFAASAGACP
jgi:hypothetical protein